jgi:signal transduction histidine kinase
LAAVDAQCRRHGARCELRSNEGQGSCFRFEIPLVHMREGEQPLAQRRLA